jgi:hypothetical protein
MGGVCDAMGAALTLGGDSGLPPIYNRAHQRASYKMSDARKQRMGSSGLFRPPKCPDTTELHDRPVPDRRGALECAVA